MYGFLSLFCSAQTDQHYVRYDDGDERWYLLSSREFTVLNEINGDVVGLKVAIEVTNKRWYVATVAAYEPDIDCHHLLYDDYPGEEEYADINSR